MTSAVGSLALSCRLLNFRCVHVNNKAAWQNKHGGVQSLGAVSASCFPREAFICVWREGGGFLRRSALSFIQRWKGRRYLELKGIICCFCCGRLVDVESYLKEKIPICGCSFWTITWFSGLYKYCIQGFCHTSTVCQCRYFEYTLKDATHEGGSCRGPEGLAEPAPRLPKWGQN